MVDLAIPTRRAAALVAVSRTTIYHKPATPLDRKLVVPPNKFSPVERAQILTALNAPQFVDLAPLQVYAKLLDQGFYLGLVSTFYRVLAENQQVKERRHLATHLARAIPELVATEPKILALPGPAWINGPQKTTQRQQPNHCLTHLGAP